MRMAPGGWRWCACRGVDGASRDDVPLPWRGGGGARHDAWAYDKFQHTLYAFVDAMPERVMFEVVYRVEDAIEAFDDAADFQWLYVPQDYDVALADVRASGAACSGRRLREGHGKCLCVGSRPCRWRGGYPLRRYGDLHGSCGRAHDVRQSAGDVPRRVADEPERGERAWRIRAPAVLLDEPLRGNDGSIRIRLRRLFVLGWLWGCWACLRRCCWRRSSFGGAGAEAAAGVSRRLLDEPACRRHGARPCSVVCGAGTTRAPTT